MYADLSRPKLLFVALNGDFVSYKFLESTLDPRILIAPSLTHHGCSKDQGSPNASSLSKSAASIRSPSIAFDRCNKLNRVDFSRQPKVSIEKHLTLPRSGAYRIVIGVSRASRRKKYTHIAPIEIFSTPLFLIHGRDRSCVKRLRRALSCYTRPWIHVVRPRNVSRTSG